MPASNISVVITALDIFIDAVIKKLTLDIVANLLKPGSEGGTPVDTGWARANWVPSLTAAISPVTQPGTDDREAKLAAVGGQSAKQQQGIANIATGYKVAFGSITISNGVPYIQRLNEGSSKQAPKAFVQAAIRRAVTVDLPAGFRV